MTMHALSNDSMNKEVLKIDQEALASAFAFSTFKDGSRTVPGTSDCHGRGVIARTLWSCTVQPPGLAEHPLFGAFLIRVALATYQK